MIRAGLIVTLAAMSACTPEAQDIVARETARGAVNSVVATRYPGLPITPLTDCVIDNASAPEIVTLASASLTGVNDTTVQTTNTILQRPATVECIGTRGLTGLLAGL